ncbi:MAG TPA: ABC transporter permease [Vicinamibacterales bacterium]|nr:ABC transporter permease [Vicinamibacterales bacterium]
MGISRFLRRSRWDEERARELESYVAIETDENIARGMPRHEARLAAVRKLGNRAIVREDIYQMNTFTIVDEVWRDLKYGARLLRLNPGFAIVAVLSLALGGGANTAIFQLLDAVRLRALPVDHPEQLVEVRIADAPHGRTGDFTSRRPMMTNPLWERIRDQQQAFSSAFAWSSVGFNLTSGGEARFAQGLWVSGDFFNTLHVPALIGRTLTLEDDRRGCAAPPAVLSYGFWQSEFGGMPAAVGRTLMLDGNAYAIVGVTPPGFFGVEVGRTFDVAVPLCAEPLTRGARSGMDKPDAWFLSIFGRLKDGWTVERATAHLASFSEPLFRETVSPRYAADDARDYLAFRLAAFPAGTGVSSLRRQYESPLWVLLATTTVVLLIACANLANLMLARATARDREVAVRLAIGASRGRVVRQMLAESLLIAAVGAGAGALVAQGLSRFLVNFLTNDSNRLFVAIALDWRTFVFTSLLAVATCLLFGLMPAVRATRTAPAAAMKAGSRGSSDSRERFGLRRALVIVQVALSMVLVVGALLFVRSLRNLTTLDPGFAEDGITVVTLDTRKAGIAPAQLAQTFDAITDRLGRLPGISSAARADIVPISGTGWNNNILIDGKKQPTYPNFNRVSADYFRAMSVPIVMGRGFDDRIDAAGSARVAIVSQSFVKTYLGGNNPIGRSFQIEAAPGTPQPLYEIVGVVKDSKYGDMREPFGPIAFLPATQADPAAASPFLQAIVRSSAAASTVTAEASAAIKAINPRIVLTFDTMRNQIEQSLLRERLMATLSAIFGGLAALIATIGLYGVMSYMVARRRSEIGIRMALGADRGEIVRMVMREAGLLLAAGVAVGLVAAVAAGRAAMALLFGLKPTDPATLLVAAAGFGMVALFASYVPAMRAARLPPTEALREE